MHYIVDGHNVMHAARYRFGGTADSARWALVRCLDGVAGAAGTAVTLVFDGRDAGGREAALKAPSFDVVYSPGDVTADTVIERMVRDAADPLAICVVTDDLAERRCVEASGAQAMSCLGFLDWVEETRSRIGQQVGRHRRRTPGVTLGDFFPDAGT